MHGCDIRVWPKEAKRMALGMIIKSADLANNTRPVPFAIEWATRLYEGKKSLRFGKRAMTDFLFQNSSHKERRRRNLD